jgi:hypothetical protein
MIRVIKRYQESKPRQHPVGMTFQYKGGSSQVLFDSPADWISPNHEGGYRDNPPAAKGRKVTITDTDHLWGIGGNPTWVWKSFLRGLNPIFMDPYDGTVLGPRDDVKWGSIRRALGATRRVAEAVNLRSMTPLGELSSTNYCLAEPGREYLVYQPEAGQSVTLQLEPGTYQCARYDTSTGEVRDPKTIRVDHKRHTFPDPDDGDWVLHVVRMQPAN